jgi:hypothetical protein
MILFILIEQSLKVVHITLRDCSFFFVLLTPKEQIKTNDNEKNVCNGLGDDGVNGNFHRFEGARKTA